MFTHRSVFILFVWSLLGMMSRGVPEASADVGMFGQRGFLHVSSGETLEQGRFNFNFHSEYTADEDLSPLSQEKYWTGHLGITYGVLDYLDVAGHAAIHRLASADSSRTGLGNLRISAKLNLRPLSSERHDVSLLAYYNTIGEDASLATIYGANLTGTGAQDLGLLLTGTYRFSRWQAHGQMGMTLASDSDNGINRPNMFHWGSSFDYPLSRQITLAAQLSGESPLADSESPADNYNFVRFTPGVRYIFNESTTVDVGFDMALTDETPAWNILLGISFTKPSLAGWFSDTDGDGLMDRDDPCPNDAEDKDGYEDEDGCPDRDNDRDRIVDSADQCPLQAEDWDGFEDGDGCPDVDNDQDGIADVEDKCPNQAGAGSADGCPPSARVKPKTAPATPTTPRLGSTMPRLNTVEDVPVILTTIQFKTNTAELMPSSYAELDQLARTLAQTDPMRYEIQGHTDNLGEIETNRALSQRRAEVVLNELVKRNISADRLVAVGYASIYPIATNKTADGRLENTRIELRAITPATVKDLPYRNLPTGLSPYCVHLTSYKSPLKTLQDIKTLETTGYPAFWMQVDVPESGTWYRVCVGDFTTYESADRHKALFKSVLDVDYAQVLNLPYTIQTGVYTNEIEARQQVAELRANGFPAYLVTVLANNQLWHRVLVSGFSTEVQAQAMLQKLQAMGIKSEVVSR